MVKTIPTFARRHLNVVSRGLRLICVQIMQSRHRFFILSFSFWIPCLTLDLALNLVQLRLRLNNRPLVNPSDRREFT